MTGYYEKATEPAHATNRKNNLTHQEEVKNAVRGKFHGQKTIQSKITPLFPDSCEREYKRVANAYVRVLSKTLQEHMPELLDAYREQKDNMRHDAALSGRIKEELQKVADDFQKALEQFGLKGRLTRVAQMVKNRAVREWKKICSKTLNVDLDGEHYSDELYGTALEEWISKNAEILENAESTVLNAVSEAMSAGLDGDDPATSAAKAIRQEISRARKSMQATCRDQIATLNTEIVRKNAKDSGSEKYIWKTRKDDRVRPCHASLEGKTFRWDDPPEMWYVTKSRGIVHTGRYCNPGEDYCCRCVAVPLFDLDTIDVPLKSKSHR